MKNIKKIRVAFFTDILKENHDGVTHTIYNIIKRIPKNEFEFMFITPLPPSDDVIFPYPIKRCSYIQMPFREDYRIGMPFFDIYLKKKLDDFKPDIIHFTSPSFLGIYAVRYAKKRKIPIVSIYHSHLINYIEYVFNFFPGFPRIVKWAYGYLYKWYYNNTAVTFVPTTPIKEDLISMGIDEKKMIIWGRGVDSKLFNPKKRDIKFIDNLCGKGTKRVLFVSRLVWEKDLKTLIMIYDYLLIKRPDVKMIITGNGPAEAYLKNRMPHAIFTGKLLHENLARIYASCDVFVFPSITETFGNVVQEAMASGLPVVVAAKGGPKGIVQDGITGFHAEPRNINDFYNKITYLLDNPKKAKIISNNGIKYARSQSWDNLCSEVFDVYKKTFNKN